MKKYQSARTALAITLLVGLLATSGCVNTDDVRLSPAQVEAEENLEPAQDTEVGEQETSLGAEADTSSKSYEETEQVADDSETNEEPQIEVSPETKVEDNPEPVIEETPEAEAEGTDSVVSDDEEEATEKQVRMPSITGMSKKDVFSWLAFEGFEFTLDIKSKRVDGKLSFNQSLACMTIGNEEVFEQRPMPGTLVENSSKTRLEGWVDCEIR